MSEEIEIDPFARIVNRHQRDVLVRAVEAREDIPDYAWIPIPLMTDEQVGGDAGLREARRPTIRRGDTCERGGAAVVIPGLGGPDGMGEVRL